MQEGPKINSTEDCFDGVELEARIPGAELESGIKRTEEMILGNEGVQLWVQENNIDLNSNAGDAQSNLEELLELIASISDYKYPESEHTTLPDDFELIILNVAQLLEDPYAIDSITKSPELLASVESLVDTVVTNPSLINLIRSRSDLMIGRYRSLNNQHVTRELRNCLEDFMGNKE